MATWIATTSPSTVTVSLDGTARTFRLSLDTSDPNRPLVLVEVLGTDGAVAATPVRFHLSDSGARIAADFPGCDPGVSIVDAEGHVTAG